MKKYMKEILYIYRWRFTNPCAVNLFNLQPDSRLNQTAEPENNGI